MCRHLAYVGAQRSLAELLLDPPHSLLRQSYAPADMRGGGTINADGFGIGWYTGASEPVRYRRTCPMWADEGLPALARSTRATAVIAAVRSATVGMPVVESAAAPFASGGWMFSHNGVVPGWPDSVEDLAATLAVRDLMTLEAPTDSALLWALVRSRLLAGADAVEALADLTRAVGARDPRARLNLLLLDGRRVVATAWDHALSVLEGEDFVALSSEPWNDDSTWRPVPDRHVVVAEMIGSRAHVEMSQLDENDQPAIPRDRIQDGAR